MLTATRSRLFAIDRPLTIGQNARCDVVGIANRPQLLAEISNKGPDLPGSMAPPRRSEGERACFHIVVEAQPLPYQALGQCHCSNGCTK